MFLNMEDIKRKNLTLLERDDLEDTNGGFVPALIGAYYATQYLVAVYGATKVATAAGMATGAAAYAYVNN